MPDANIGAFYKCKNLEAALSINQFLNRKLKPLQNEYLLKRYYSAFILYDFPISQKQSYLRTQIIYNHYGRQNDFASSINYIHLKKYGIGLSYRRYGGISLLFKLSKITLSKGNELNLGLSASLLAINSISREYQISLTYRLGHLSPHKN